MGGGPYGPPGRESGAAGGGVPHDHGGRRDARSHYCDTGEIYWRLLRLFAQTGFMPGSRRLVDMVPVDQAARAVVALASQPDCYGKAFHMNSRDKQPWETMHKILSWRAMRST